MVERTCIKEISTVCPKPSNSAIRSVIALSLAHYFCGKSWFFLGRPGIKGVQGCMDFIYANWADLITAIFAYPDTTMDLCIGFGYCEPTRKVL